MWKKGGKGICVEREIWRKREREREREREKEREREREKQKEREREIDRRRKKCFRLWTSTILKWKSEN